MLEGWQPMETAPKNGDKVLLSRKGRVLIGHWDIEKYHVKPRPYWKSDEPWASVIRDRASDPDGWMPLPAPKL